MSADSLLLLPLNMFSISRDRQSLRCKLFQSVFLPCFAAFLSLRTENLDKDLRTGWGAVCSSRHKRVVLFSSVLREKHPNLQRQAFFFCASELPCRQILAWISFHYFSWFHSWCFLPFSPPSSLVNLYRLYSSPSKDIKEETKCWLPSVPYILLDLRNIQRCYTSNGNFFKSWL